VFNVAVGNRDGAMRAQLADLIGNRFRRPPSFNFRSDRLQPVCSILAIVPRVLLILIGTPHREITLRICYTNL
jgi:hypothetical protein